MISILQSKRFANAFDAASPGLQRLAIGEVEHLKRRLEQGPATAMRQFRAMHGLHGRNVYELELGGGPRLLVHQGSPAITLLDMGPHEITDAYTDDKLKRDLAGASSITIFLEKAEKAT